MTNSLSERHTRSRAARRPRSRPRKAIDAMSAARLEHIPNIGPSLAADLRRLNVREPDQLRGRDPWQLYEALCQATGARQDPCVLDAFISAVRFMEGEPARPWWHYTEERKRVMRQRARRRPGPERVV